MSSFQWLFPVVGKSEYSGGSWMPGALTHRGRTHPAIDIYADRGSAIIAPVGGVVQRVSSGEIGGHTISIKGDDGYVYYFAHMDAPTTLIKGQRFGAGQLLGAVGNSGSAKRTSPHLHLKMSKNGTAVNPKRFLDHGYKVPAESVAAQNELEPVAPPAYGMTYEDPLTIAENIAFHSEDDQPQEPEKINAQQFLSYTMDAVSNLAAGGQREDYRAIVPRNPTPASEVRLQKATDTGGMEVEA